MVYYNYKTKRVFPLSTIQHACCTMMHERYNVGIDAAFTTFTLDSVCISLGRSGRERAAFTSPQIYIYIYILLNFKLARAKVKIRATFFSSSRAKRYVTAKNRLSTVFDSLRGPPRTKKSEISPRAGYRRRWRRDERKKDGNEITQT